MTAILLRIIIYVAIAAFVYFGAKRLWRDFTAAFRAGGPAAPPPGGSPKVDQRKSPDVIELERDADGVYRPPGDRQKR